MLSQYAEWLVVALVCTTIGCGGMALWQNHQQRLMRRERLQQIDVAHAARLGIAAELTASIVHEINQPLGAILSNADAALLLLRSEHPPLDLIHDILTDIRADDLRASDVIRQLRALLRKRDIETEPLQVNALLSGTARIVGNMALMHHTAFRTELTEALPEVDGDWTHLQQVVISLALNAMEAMAAQPAETRSLVLRSLRLPGGDIAIEVEDSGPGVPIAVRDRLFDAYFSTKPEGMGMGLAIARTIVLAHRGQIDLRCHADGGTVFRVRLPACPTEQPALLGVPT